MRFGDVGGSVNMKNARNRADCTNGDRNISATAPALTIDAAVNATKYVPRNASTSGNLLRRSTMNTPHAMSTSANGPGASPSAPHQLWPLLKIGTLNNSASAAGLKKCSRWFAKTYLVTLAKPATQNTATHGSWAPRMNATISPLSNALVGTIQRRDSQYVYTRSTAHAASAATTMLGRTASPPSNGAAISNS